MFGIFVYGTLMKGFCNHNIIENGIKSITPAETRGTLYHLPEGYPALVEGKGTIFGEVIELEDDKYMDELDALEEYYGPGCENLYDRVQREVQISGGGKVVCWVYVYCDEIHAREYGILVEDGNWRRWCLMKDRLPFR